MELVFLVSLLPMTMWGLSDYLSERFSKSLTPYGAYFIINVGGLPLSLAASAINGTQIPGNWNQAAQMSGVSFLFVAAYIALMKALEIGPTGIASTTAGCYVLITVFLGIIFGLEITKTIVVGTLFVFTGGTLLSVENSNHKTSFFASKTFRIALISVAGWGFGFFLASKINRINWSDQNLILVVVPLFISASIVEYTGGSVKQTLTLMFRRDTLVMWIPGLTSTIGLLGFFAAVDLGNNSVIIPAVVASASPVLSTLLARLFSKEKLLRINIIGMFVVVSGVMLLNAG